MSVILCSICIFSFYFENLNWKIFSCCYLDVCLIFSCLRYLVFWVLPSELDINVASLKWQLSFPEEQVIRLFNPGDIYSRSNKTLCSFSWTRYFPSFIGPSYWWNWKEETFFFMKLWTEYLHLVMFVKRKQLLWIVYMKLLKFPLLDSMLL